MVLFHQSLDGCLEWPPMMSLSEEERQLYCDPEFYRLQKILMIADSESYTLLKDVEWIAEIRGKFEASNQAMIDRWNEKAK
jgi:hypothetical protein